MSFTSLPYLSYLSVLLVKSMVIWYHRMAFMFIIILIKLYKLYVT